MTNQETNSKTRIIFIRHGQSEANVENVFAGQRFDAHLTALGIKQARITAQYVSEQYKVDKVFASDLERATNTGRIIYDYCKVSVPLETDTRFREIDEGEWSRVPFEELKTKFKKDYGIWLSDIGISAATGGESISHLSARVQLASLDIANRNQGLTLLVATHATPVRTVVTPLSGKKREEMRLVPWVSNASVTEISIDNSKMPYGEALKDIQNKFSALSCIDSSSAEAKELEAEIWRIFTECGSLELVGYDKHLAGFATALPVNV